MAAQTGFLARLLSDSSRFNSAALRTLFTSSRPAPSPPARSSLSPRRPKSRPITWKPRWKPGGIRSRNRHVDDGGPIAQEWGRPGANRGLVGEVAEDGDGEVDGTVLDGLERVGLPQSFLRRHAEELVEVIRGLASIEQDRWRPEALLPVREVVERVRGRGKKVEVLWGMALGKLLQAGEWAEMVLLTEAMVRVDCRPNVVVMNLTMKGLLKLQMHEQAWKWYDALRAKGGFNPDMRTFRHWVLHLVQCGEMEEAEKVWQESVKHKLKDEERLDALNWLIRGWFVQGQMDRAQPYIDLVSTGKIKPDDRVYNTVLYALINVGMVSHAQRLFWSLQADGGRLNIGVWNTMVLGLCSFGHMNSVRRLWGHMDGQGIEPNRSTYLSTVRGFAKIDKLREAEEFLKRGKEKGALDDWVTVADVVEGKLRVKGPFVGKRTGGLVREGPGSLAEALVSWSKGQEEGQRGQVGRVGEEGPRNGQKLGGVS